LPKFSPAQRLQAACALRAQVFQSIEEILAGQLLAEQHQLQRLQHPRVADGKA
jgi:hypothetical protein